MSESRTLADGRYEIIRLLGRGGWGEVFLAMDHALQRPVAIKQLRPELAADVELCKAFLREAQKAARISHENIVQIHDVRPQDLCLVMEYVAGPSLLQCLEHKQLNIEDSLHVLDDITKGVQALHDRGIIHRDLKPGNFLLSLPVEQAQDYEEHRRLPAELTKARTKIADFGLSRVEALESAATMSSMGTPEYMAPEQKAGKASSPRTDIYALGVIAHQLLTGDLPAAGKPLDLPHSRTSEAIRRALETKPEDRFQSARDFFQALRFALTQQADQYGPLFLSRFDLKWNVIENSGKQLAQEFRCRFGSVHRVQVTSGLLQRSRSVFAAIALHREPPPDLLQQVMGPDALDLEATVTYTVGILSPSTWPAESIEQIPVRGNIRFYLVEKGPGTSWNISPAAGPHRDLFDPESNEEKEAAASGVLTTCPELSMGRDLIAIDALLKKYNLTRAYVEMAIAHSAGRFRLIENNSKTFIQRTTF